MSTFSQFITSNTVLDPKAIQEAGLASAPFPEVASIEEIKQLGMISGTQTVDVWAYGYGKPPRHFDSIDLENAANISFQEGYDNILLFFHESKMLIWLPADHEFFVICADLDLFHRIQSSGIFTYDFTDYMSEDYFHGKKSDYLRDIYSTYALIPFGTE